MHQYQKRRRRTEEDRIPSGKARVKETRKVFKLFKEGRNGHDNVEDCYSIPFRRPQMMGKTDENTTKKHMVLRIDMLSSATRRKPSNGPM